MTFRLAIVVALGAAACSSSHTAGQSSALAGQDGSLAGQDGAVCDPPTTEMCPSTVPSFSAEVAPILDQRCNNCHAPDIDGGPWPLDTQQNVSDWSILLIKDLKECTMPPPDSPLLPTAERDKLWAWLICGAPNN